MIPQPSIQQMLSGLEQTLPMLIMIVGGMVTMLMAVAKSHKEGPTTIEASSYLAVGLLTVAVAFVILTQVPPQKAPVWFGTLAIDRLALVGQGLILAITGVAMCFGAASMTELAIVRGEYFALTLFSAAGMMLMVSATELLTFFVGLEIMSLAIYVLVGFRRSDRWSQEASLKYFLNGAFASAFFMFGAALLYGVTGGTDYGTIATYVQRGDAGSLIFMTGAMMCVIAFAFKVAAVPFHMWAPDAYQGAPTMVTAFMAVAVKAAAFVAFVRFALLVGTQSAIPKMETLLVGLAIATMTIGNLSAVLQRNVKRMLAYSSIAQAGYLLVGMVGALHYGETAVQAILFYLFVYGLATLGAFGVLIALERRGGRHDEQLVNRYAGVGFTYPGLGVAFAVCMFALSGIPPTSGFLGKVLLFGPALNAGHVWLVVIAVMNSVVSVYYYLRVVVYMFMKASPSRVATEPRALSPWLTGALALTSVLVIVVGVLPSEWLGAFSKIL